MIQVTDFHKAYRGTIAVAALSFDVQPGQVLGLLGPNGAGKTTTMRAIAGVIPATQGSLVVGGHEVSADPVAAKRLLAYVPDDPRLFDALTVWEHLQFIASAYRVNDFEANASCHAQRYAASMASRLPRPLPLAVAVSGGSRGAATATAFQTENTPPRSDPLNTPAAFMTQHAESIPDSKIRLGYYAVHNNRRRIKKTARTPTSPVNRKNQNAFNNTRTTRVKPDFAFPMNCWKILFVTSMNSSIPASRSRVS